jgi:hypothetical protein
MVDINCKMSIEEAKKEMEDEKRSVESKIGYKICFFY